MSVLERREPIATISQAMLAQAAEARIQKPLSQALEFQDRTEELAALISVGLNS